jgi:hypothetical protein
MTAKRRAALAEKSQAERFAEIEAQTSRVISVTVRAVNQIQGTLHLVDGGTPQAYVSATIGDVLIYVRSLETARHLLAGWNEAEYVAKRLPKKISRRWLGVAAEDYTSTAVVRFAGYPAFTSVHMGARKDIGVPEHARMQFGPLVWQVCDQDAYVSIRTLLMKICQLLDL